MRVQPTFGSGLNSGVKRGLNTVRGAHVKGVKWVEPGFNPLLWCPCERGGYTYYCKVGGTAYAVGESLPSSDDSETGWRYI